MSGLSWLSVRWGKYKKRRRQFHTKERSAHVRATNTGRASPSRCQYDSAGVDAAAADEEADDSDADDDDDSTNANDPFAGFSVHVYKKSRTKFQKTNKSKIKTISERELKIPLK